MERRPSSKSQLSRIAVLLLGFSSAAVVTALLQLNRAEIQAPPTTRISDEETANVILLDYEGLLHNTLDSFYAKSDTEQPVISSRAELLAALGAPASCPIESDGLIASAKLMVEVSQGHIYQVRGHAECDTVRLPWFALVGVPRSAATGTLLLFHGTASNPEQLFGFEGQDAFPDYTDRAALKALTDGFVVIVPLILTDSGRVSEASHNSARNRIDRRAQALGFRLLGLEQVAISHLVGSLIARYSEPDTPIIAYGISLGGKIAFYQAALSNQIDVVIVSNWIEDRFAKTFDRESPHALWRYESMDYAILDRRGVFVPDESVAALIYPRGLIVEVGREDPRKESMQSTVAKISQIYKRHPNQMSVVVGEGGHQMFYNPAMKLAQQMQR